MLLDLWFCCENCYDKPKNCNDKPNVIKFLGPQKWGIFIGKGVRLWRPNNIFCTFGAGADSSNGVDFEYNRKLLSLRTFAVSFRRTALNSDFT